MMKKLTILLFLLFILSITSIHAEGLTGAVRLPTPDYTEHEIPKGQNGIATLLPYTRTYVKIYEGSKLDFTIFDQQTRMPIINNSIILDKINDGSINVRLGTEGKQYESTTITIGERNQLQINYTTKSVPFMFLQEYKYKYLEGSKDNYAVLYLNVPMFSRVKEPEVTPKQIDTNKPTGGETKINYLPYLLIAGVGLLVIAIILYTRGQEPEEKEETKQEEVTEKPKTKKNSRKKK